MLMEIKNVTVNYEKVEVLKSVSIDIEDGEVVALIGANGAGKTTTLRVISGLKRYTTGEIYYEGNDIRHEDPQTIVRMGIVHVPEGRRIFSNMSVYENLIAGAFLRKDKRGIKNDLAEQYKQFPRLLERRKQRAESLSGGEQQMLAIARALMAKPKLMLLDEPTMGLSPLFVNYVADIIKTINKNKVSILLVEQNARVALRLAKKCYVFESGRIVLSGTSEEMQRDEHVKEAYLGA